MAQKIGLAYRDKARTEPLNERFKDITGPSVLRGFRLQLGTSNHTVSLVRAEYLNSVAFSPSGVRIEETTDLIDVISIEPNVNTSGLPRVDSVYLVYQYGPNSSFATYAVVKGTDVAAPNPNLATHLLLGLVRVSPNNYPLQASNLESIPYGFSSFKVAGSSSFSGASTFEKGVTFKGPVTFMDGTTGGSGEGGSGGTPTIMERLSAPIIASAGQQTFTLPSEYRMNSKTLFVFSNGDQVDPTKYQEVTSTTFRFHDPQVLGTKIWAYWHVGVEVYTMGTHAHNDAYYQKWEINNRSVRFVTDFFNGSLGRTIKHFLGNQKYVIMAITPTEKTADVGTISTEKRDDEIIVYNSGTYRGKFDLTYILENSYEYTPTGEELGFLNILSSDEDTTQHIYKVVDQKRKDGTLYVKSTLSTPNANGRYTRLKVDFYNTTGVSVVKTVTWALNYDARGTITSKTIV